MTPTGGNQMAEIDYTQYYDLESYLFGEVSERYQRQKTLSTADFFCIVIWKANRAKSKVAKQLLRQNDNNDNLDSAVETLVKDISKAADARMRLSVLIEKWGFRLPMASAILTVLFP